MNEQNKRVCWLAFFFSRSIYWLYLDCGQEFVSVGKTWCFANFKVRVRPHKHAEHVRKLPSISQ